MGRLHTVELGRLDVVVGAQRDIDHLIEIHVEIAETEIVRAVRAGHPALEDGKHGLTVGAKVSEHPLRFLDGKLELLGPRRLSRDRKETGPQGQGHDGP